MNIRSTRKETQYCLLDENGKDYELRSGITRKQAIEIYAKYYPGEKVYKRCGNLFDGFTYTEVEI